MRLRFGLIAFYCSLCIWMLSSCLGDDTYEEEIVSEDAHILSFRLSSDSLTNLASTVFSIDQYNGLIFNHDSMAYQTTFSNKVKVTYSMASSGGKLRFEGDTTTIKSGDSINIARPFPITFVTTAPDGRTIKNYKFQINIHTVDPDSVYYERIANSLDFLNADEIQTVSFNNAHYVYTRKQSTVSLFQSGDMINWTELSVHNFPETGKLNSLCVADVGLYSQEAIPSIYVLADTGELYASTDLQQWEKVETPYPVLSLLGSLKLTSIQLQRLAVLMEKDGLPVYAYTTDLETWNMGVAPADDFPFADAQRVAVYSMNKERITLIGGRNSSNELLNTVWCSEDGLYWVKMNSAQSSYPLMDRFSAFMYDNELYLINGQLPDGTINKSLYYSMDGGITWLLKSSKFHLPDAYEARFNSSMITDEPYFYILGGRNTTVFTDIWRGYKNENLF